MKKLIALVLALVCVFALASCGKSNRGDYPATIMVNGTNYYSTDIVNPSSLSGTNFQSTKINTSDTTSNTDPLGRSLTPEGSDMAKSNSNKTTKDQQKGKDLN